MDKKVIVTPQVTDESSAAILASLSGLKLAVTSDGTRPPAFVAYDSKLRRQLRLGWDVIVADVSADVDMKVLDRVCREHGYVLTSIHLEPLFPDAPPAPVSAPVPVPEEASPPILAFVPDTAPAEKKTPAKKKATTTKKTKAKKPAAKKAAKKTE